MIKLERSLQLHVDKQLNPLTPKQALTNQSILLCLMPDDFTCTRQWETPGVNGLILFCDGMVVV